jgi:hypothetical protein
MQVYSQSIKGFLIDTELANDLGLLDEFLIWEEVYDVEPFREAFEEKYGVAPLDLKHFEYSREGHIKSLSGFDWDETYVVFDELTEDLAEWSQMVKELEKELDILIEEGSWSEVE